VGQQKVGIITRINGSDFGLFGLQPHIRFSIITQVGQLLPGTGRRQQNEEWKKQSEMQVRRAHKANLANRR
jgi:hypothetical protein